MKKMLSLLGALTITSSAIPTLIVTEFYSKHEKEHINIQQNSLEWEQLDYEKVKNIEAKLKEKIIGQDYAISKIKTAVYNAYTGLGIFDKNKAKPKGPLFFAGPTGVGKTFLAKQLKKYLFGEENNFIRFDMSEYNSIASQNKFIDAFKKEQLEHINILLFDEIEKADPKILDNFLQILDEGYVTNSKGVKITFANSLIIFTSNIGATEIQYKDKAEEVIRQEFIEKVSNYFINTLNRPELLSRIGINNIVPFNFISNKVVQTKLISDNLKAIASSFESKYKAKLEFSNLDSIVNLIVNNANIQLGIRGLENSIEKIIVDSLSEFILNNKNSFSEKYKIVCEVSNDEIKYSFQPIGYDIFLAHDQLKYLIN